MQIFARCGGVHGTMALDVDPWDTVWSAKRAVLRRLGVSDTCSDAWLAHAGRACPEEASLAAAGLREGGTLDLHLRLRGGGGDGGSTGAESRSSFLEMYARKKTAKTNPLENKLARWTTCQLSGERLAPPVVADELGSLFNKDAVVTALVTRSLPPALGHISALRHLIDLTLARNPTYAGPASASAADFQPGNGAEWCCPVTGLELNGRYRFVVLRRGGHVVSEKALKEVPAAVEEHVGGPWAPEDVLPLNGAREEVLALREALQASRAAAAARKAEKKKRSGKRLLADGAGAAAGAAASADGAAAGLAGSGAAAGAREAGGAAAAGGRAGEGGGAKRAAEGAVAAAEERARAHRFKAGEAVPAHSTKGVWASIFTSAQAEVRETYGCRALSARGL